MPFYRLEELVYLLKKLNVNLNEINIYIFLEINRSLYIYSHMTDINMTEN